MSELREPTDAELDIVGGGNLKSIRRERLNDEPGRRRWNKAGRGDHCRYSQDFGTRTTNTIGGGEIIIKARPSVSLVAGGFAVAGEFVSFPAFLFERRPERREGSLGF